MPPSRFNSYRAHSKTADIGGLFLGSAHWLSMLVPVGLVVSPSALVKAQAFATIHPPYDLVRFRKRSQIAAALRIGGSTFRAEHDLRIQGKRYVMLRLGESNTMIPIPEGQLVTVERADALPPELQTCVAQLGRYRGKLRSTVQHFLRELQRRVGQARVRYDKDGEEHYNIASAFIKACAPAIPTRRLVLRCFTSTLAFGAAGTWARPRFAVTSCRHDQ